MDVDHFESYMHMGTIGLILITLNPVCIYGNHWLDVDHFEFYMHMGTIGWMLITLNPIYICEPLVEDDSLGR